MLFKEVISFKVFVSFFLSVYFEVYQNNLLVDMAALAVTRKKII